MEVSTTRPSIIQTLESLSTTTSIWHIISGMDTLPIPPASIKCSLKEVLSDNKIDSNFKNSSNLNSDSPSLALTHGESNYSLDSIHGDYFSSSDNHNISSLVSSSFSSKDDLTSYSTSDKVHRDFPSSLSENYDISAFTSSLHAIRGSTSFPSTSNSINISITSEE